MIRREILLSLLLTWPMTCPATAAWAQAEKSPVPAPQEGDKIPENVDAERYARAAVVLRAKLIKPLGGETGVTWYQVKVVETLKSTGRQKFGPTLDVFTAGRIGPGVKPIPGPPAEESTLYLEPVVQRVGAEDVTHWRIISK